MQALGRAYSVPAEKLRLDDGFKAELGTVDSWIYGEGGEEVERFLETQYPGVKLEGIVTIRDLLTAVANTIRGGIS